jgi:hypothetical protein
VQLLSLRPPDHVFVRNTSTLNVIASSPNIIFNTGFMPFYIASSISKATRELKVSCSLCVIIKIRVLNSLFKLYKAIVTKTLLLTIALNSRSIIIALLTLFRYLATP